MSSLLLALLALLFVGSTHAQATTAATAAPKTPNPSLIDPTYPPDRAQELAARNTLQYRHGSQFQFTIHIEATAPLSNSLPANSTLYRRAVFYPTVDQLSRLTVTGSAADPALALYQNVSVFFEVGDSYFGGYPVQVDKRLWRSLSRFTNAVVYNRYWEFLIFADCKKTDDTGTGDLACGTILAADVSDDGCGIGCLDDYCLDPKPAAQLVRNTNVTGTSGDATATTTTTVTETTATTETTLSDTRPGRRCFAATPRDITVFVGWSGTSADKVAFSSRKELPSTYQKYAFGDLGSAVNDEFSLFS